MRDYTNRSRRFTRIFYGNLQSKGYGGSRTYNAVRTGQPVCFFKGCSAGLHFQKQYPQGKLVRVIKGCVFDVAVDLRENSQTYGKWFGVELSEENKKQFYIPEGFAHGFLVLSDTAEFCYKCTDFYHPNDEGGLAWNDPEIGIVWPKLTGSYNGTPSGDGYSLDDGTKLLLSDKDQLWKGLKDTFHFA